MPHPLASHVRRMLWAVAAGALVLGAAALAHEQAQSRQQIRQRAAAMTGGDPAAGRRLIRSHGCGGCHTIPGVVQARGKVGPPLSGVAGRAYIAGRLRNTPANLIAWVDDPKAVDPATVMPDAGVTRDEARDIAAYLYTLQ